MITPMVSPVESARNIVRQNLLNGTADGVVGAGVDSLKGTLVVLWSNEASAKTFLSGALGRLYSLVDLRSGQLPPASPRFRARDFIEFFRGILSKAGSPSLAPGTRIMPLSGEAGRISCFVELKDGSVVALTSNHLFYYRAPSDPKTNSVFLYGGSTTIGNSLVFPALSSAPGRGNLADCAAFGPVGVNLQADPAISGRFVGQGDLFSIEGASMVSLAPKTGSGVALDTDAVVKYELDDNNLGTVEYVFDSQILVKDGGGTYPFGIQGDSGALVLLDQNTGPLQKGDAVGIHSWTDAVNEYYFVTPLCVSMDQVGATSIFNSGRAVAFREGPRRE